MCPDKQLLSAYCDGEVPSPWRQRIDAHLAECACCRQIAARYRALGAILREAAPPAADSFAYSRVREGVFASGAGRPSLWKKRISLPLAAAAALIFFGSGMVFSALSRAAPEARPLAQGRRAENAANVRNMNELLEMLENGDSEGELTITLPEARNFQSYGKPVFLRAEDFPGDKRQ
jgi:anti-sigma factor RsiW